MPNNNRNHICDLYCGACSARFKNRPCPHYDLLTQECAFLRAQQAEKLWETAADGTPLCRCAFEVFNTTVNRANETLQRQYADLPIDEVEDIDLDALISRLKTLRLTKGFTLTVWRKYLNIMAYREFRRRIIRQGLLSEHRQFVSLDDEIDVAHPDEQRRVEDALLEQIQAANAAHAQEAASITNSLYGVGERLLRERADREPIGSVRRKICRRQHEVFINIRALLKEGIPMEKAENTLAKRYGLKDARTIRRDLEEIRAFLQENVRDA